MTTIGHLRLRASCQVASSAAVRGAAEELLAATELRPSEAPAGSLLVVRHLDGLPPLAYHEQSRTARERWTQAAHERIAYFYRNAHHPIRSAVPAGAQSVLFGDNAELLACFTNDLLMNTLWMHWYWRHIRVGRAQRPLLATQTGARGTLLAEAWSALPEALPAALAHLPPAKIREAIGSLSGREVSMVVQALHRAFLLPNTILGVTLSEQEEATMPPQGDGKPAQPPVATRSWPFGHEQPRQSGEVEAKALPAPPWQRWLAAEIRSPLTPQAIYLAGLCAALFHAPAYGRSDSFARRAALWMEQALRQVYKGQVATPAPSLSSHTPLAKTPTHDEGRSPAQANGASSRISMPATTASALPETLAPLDSPAANEAMRLAQANGAPSQAPTPATTASAQPEILAPFDSPAANESMRLAQVNRSLLQAPTPATPANALPEMRLPIDAVGAQRVDNEARPPHLSGENAAPFDLTLGRLPLTAQGQWTALAGIFYLIHTLPWLALPGKWSEALSAWAILELLASTLLSAKAALEDQGDMVWRLLAALDNRQPKLPLGAALVDDSDYALSAEELALAPAWVRDEFERYSAAGAIESGRAESAESAERPFVALRVSANAERWLAPRAGFYRRLLQRALGEEALTTLLAARGQISVSHTHLDLYLPINEVNMAVRRAGLDANPGWSPDFGYIIFFHFVEPLDFVGPFDLVEEPL